MLGLTIIRTTELAALRERALQAEMAHASALQQLGAIAGQMAAALSDCARPAPLPTPPPTPTGPELPVWVRTAAQIHAADRAEELANLAEAERLLALKVAPKEIVARLARGDTGSDTLDLARTASSGSTDGEDEETFVVRPGSRS